MLPLVLVLVGGAAVLGGLAVLRSFGPGFRLGRLLATVPRVPIAEAVRLAESGDRRFVAVEGRIDSDDEFEDAAHRPLVLRRTRLEARIGQRWRRFEESLEAVPFEIRDGLDSIGLDTTALGVGLVVLTRESLGVVGDLGDRAPDDLPADAPARVLIDQVSSVEQATVLGWPSRDDDGRPVMTAGAGRPLILTTLSSAEAMRVLARGERVRPWLAAALLVGGLVLAILGLAWGGMEAAGGLLGVTRLGPAVVLAADASSQADESSRAADASIRATGPQAAAEGPGAALSPQPSASIAPLPSELAGDTRSSGEGPGLVGAPGLAILAVLGLGLVATGATLLYVRLTGGPTRR